MLSSIYFQSNIYTLKILTFLKGLLNIDFRIQDEIRPDAGPPNFLHLSLRTKRGRKKTLSRPTRPISSVFFSIRFFPFSSHFSTRRPIVRIENFPPRDL